MTPNPIRDGLEWTSLAFPDRGSPAGQRALGELGEELFDLAVNREASGVRLRENKASIDYHVELTRLSRPDFDLGGEARFE